MFKNLLPVLAILFFSINVNAQVKCAADEIRDKATRLDPDYKRSIDEMDANLRHYIQTHQPSVNTNIQTPIYYIPCVVHVIHAGGAVGDFDNPTDAQIVNAINYVNKVYDGTWTGTGGPILGAGDLQVKFVLATKDPNNAATTGIDRVNGTTAFGATYTNFGANADNTTGVPEATVKNLSRWDPFKYYNIWTVNKIDGCSGTFCGCACDAGFIAGYAYFPPSNNTSSAIRDLDGTLMLASQMVAGEKTLPHEIGHALNLYHPFEGSDPTSNGSNVCPANASPATQGDRCTDTDPITNPYLAPNTPFACRTGATNPCVSPALFTANTESNYMNYTNCYQLFTNDQKSRMASIASSWANNQGTYPTSFTAPAPAAVTPVSGLASPGLAGIMSVSLNGRIIYSLNSAQDGGYVDGTGRWYDLFDLQKNTAYSMTVVLRATNNEQLGVWLDYDGNGSFNTTTEQLYRVTNISVATAAAGVVVNFTTPATWNSGIVRMRLTEDLSTIYGVTAISNNSASLQYGQAEDYPAFLNAGTLPVTLVDFSGSRTGSTISLKWRTSQELNMKGFEVQRSTNGRDFSGVGNVAATNNVTGASYSLNDAVSNSGTYFYRLKIIDKDASFTYSSIASFKVSNRLQVNENPFTDKITVQLPKTSGTVAFRLLDASGRTVYQEKQLLSNQTAATVYLKDKSITAGIYILDVMINGERFTERLIKQ